VPRARLTFALVLAGAALLLLLRAGSVPLLDPDESRFARTSVEMLSSGDLVVPRFEGEPRLVKPPLVHWIQVFMFSVLGTTELAARLHAALATLVTILLVGWVGWQRFGPEGAVWASAILATTPLALAAGRVGTVDALLAPHVLAVVALDLATPRGDRSYRALTLGALLGLAFLAKGPVGVILPLLIVLAGRTATRRDVVPSLGAVLQALAAWCVVVLPWGLVLVRRVGAGTVTEVLRSEVFERYFVGTLHLEPAWFYLEVAAVGLLPWTAPLVIALGRVWRLRREPGSRTALYAAAGLLVGLAFFSFSPTKLASYLLPLAPLAALLVTWEIGFELRAPHERRWGPTLASATAASTAVLLGFGVLRLDGPPRTVAILGAAAYGAAALIAIGATLHHRIRVVHASVAGAAATFLLGAVLVLLPWLAERKSAAPLIEAVPVLASSRPAVTVEVRVPSLTFYLSRPVEVLSMEDLEERLAREDDPLFVLVDSDLGDVPPEVRLALREVGRHGKFIVFERNSR
jgi:4-amino-4-deoxy-L-arabinose transferase-like glycosyltransferase